MSGWGWFGRFRCYALGLINPGISAGLFSKPGPAQAHVLACLRPFASKLQIQLVKVVVRFVRGIDSRHQIRFARFGFKVKTPQVPVVHHEDFVGFLLNRYSLARQAADLGESFPGQPKLFSQKSKLPSALKAS